MAGDALLTRAATITSATTTYPTGLVDPGGTAVDEVDLTGMNLCDPLAATVIVQNISGTNTKFAVSFVTHEDAAFGSETTVIPSLDITANGYHLLGWLPPVEDRYGRFVVVSTTDTAVNGDVICRLERGADSRRFRS